jgi:hypothetical protein
MRIDLEGFQKRQATKQAMSAAVAALETQSEKTVEHIVEMRACKFAQRPALLENIDPGLSGLAPRKMAARVIVLIDGEFAAPRRGMGFGGEIPLLNLNAAYRYAIRLVAIAEKKGSA